MTRRLRVTHDPARTAARIVADALSATVHRTGRARLAIPGGTTPGRVFRWLAAHLDPHVREALWVTWTDERHLPVDGVVDPRLPNGNLYPEGSNLRLAWDTWLGLPDQDVARILPLSTGDSLYADQIRAERALQGDWAGTIDVVLLSAGSDGHIASLFPYHPSTDAGGTCVAITDSPKPPLERVSLTLSTLETAATTVVLATGGLKAIALSRAWDGDRALPLGRLSPRGDIHWVLDQAAANKLTPY